VKRGLLAWLILLETITAVSVVSRAAFDSWFAATAEGPNTGAPADELQAFAALSPIDTHAHVFKNDPAFYSMLEHLHLFIVDICVATDHDPHYKDLRQKISDALTVVRSSRGHATLCTTFNPYTFREPGFSAQSISQLNQDFAEGAVAVKVWKNIGMDLKNSQGHYVMPDDPVFAPIYHDIAAHHKTLIAHLAEPTSCWRPPDPASPDYEYYRQHPEWYMYLHPDHPSKEAILAARDHLLAENPTLRVVGAHLGSMETDVDEIARHFDRYPNFAVDTAARVPYLMLQPREKVRAFLIKYQERVLYGTDLDLYPQSFTESTLREWMDVYLRDWKFFATAEAIQYKGRQVHGLKLPGPVLHKLYHDNAVKWIPGVIPTSRRRLQISN
jgi:predicted TIM-barrel fold metal-dependent hydrolase